MQEISFRLSCTVDNAGSYLVGTDNVHVAYQDSVVIIPVGGSTREGTASLNSTAKDILFPNDTAHPTRMYVDYWHYSMTSHKNNKTEFRVGGTALLSKASDTKENMYGTFNSSAVTSATKSTAIQCYIKSNTSLGWVSFGGEGMLIITYFNRYDFSATAGSGVSSASVSSATGYDGDTIQYRCVLANGATWHGWYLNGSLYSSAKDLDVTVNGADLNLEARATVITGTLTASYNGSTILTVQASGSLSVTYNGGTIANISRGTAKTLKCNGKYMMTDIGIGSSRLKCANRIMADDVYISYT